MVSGSDLRDNLLKDFFKPQCFLTSSSEAGAESPLNLLVLWGAQGCKQKRWFPAPWAVGAPGGGSQRPLGPFQGTIVYKPLKMRLKKNKISLKVNTSFHFPPPRNSLSRIRGETRSAGVTARVTLASRGHRSVRLQTRLSQCPSLPCARPVPGGRPVIS